MKRIFFLPVLLAILLAGCSHTIALNPNIQPNAFFSEKLPYSVAVVFSSEMVNYVEHARPSSNAGSAHTYDFVMGESLCSALTRSLETAYTNVSWPETTPQKGEYDRIVKFAIQNSNLDVYFQDGFFTTSGKANYSLSISMEAYDGQTLELLQRTVVTGSGFSSRGTDAFSADKSFAQAVEAGIQQVSDNIANLLISGFAEPKHKSQVAGETGSTTPVETFEEPKTFDMTEQLTIGTGKIGIRFQNQVVKDVVSSGPADRAGVKVGDKILAANGTALNGVDSHDAALITGSPGTTVKLTIQREGQIFEIPVKRE